MGEQPVESLSEDFVITRSGHTPDQVKETLVSVDAPAKPVPPPVETPPAEAAPAGDESTETVEPPASAAPEADAPAVGGTTDPAVAAAAAALPKGDSKAGKTLSDRGRMIQAEIHQLTAQKYQSRAEVDAARLELAQLQAERARIQTAQAAAPPPAAPKADAPKKPVAENFSTFEEYTDAVGQYYRDEAKREAVAEATAEVQRQLQAVRDQADAQRMQAEQHQLLQQHQARLADARTAHPDFDEVVSGSGYLKTNPMMDAHIVQSALGGELMHYLATHPDECETIAALPAGPTLVALGRIEARIDGAKSGPPAVRPPVSRAQPPVKPVGASSGIADESPGAGASLDEHFAYWNRKERDSRSARR